MSSSRQSRFAPTFKNEEFGEIYNSFRSGNKEKAIDWVGRSLNSELNLLGNDPGGEGTLLTAALSWETRSLADCILHASRFLEKSSENDDSNNMGYAHYIMALSKRDTGDNEGALKSFSKIPELCPRRQIVYLNWADLAMKQDDKAVAKTIVERGLENADETAELEMIQKSILGKPTVSACMIVKNEEEFLPRCLASIRDYVDEIILVDTGSTDKTIEIARQFGCKIFEQPWEGDFSKHRNYSIDQSTGDWIFIIDADEELMSKDIAHLTDALRQTDHQMISLTVYNKAERLGKSSSFLPSVRLFRKELGLRYEGIVHNRLNYSSNTPELRIPVGIAHYGYDLDPDKMVAKFERSGELLEKQLKENPDFAPGHFNLAQLIRARSNLKDDKSCNDVITHAKKVIELTEPKSLEHGSIHLMAHHQIATAYFGLRDFERAEEYCQRALKLAPDYLDPIITLGHIYVQTRAWIKAREWFNKYLESQERYSEHTETNTLIVINLDSRHNAFYNLGITEENCGNWLTAKEHYEKALEIIDPYLDCYSRIGWMSIKLENYSAAAPWFDKQIKNEPSDLSACIGMAETLICQEDVLGAEAVLKNGLKTVDAAEKVCERLLRLFNNTEQWDKTISLSEDALKKFPQESVLRVRVAEAELMLRNYADAIKNFNHAESCGESSIELSLGLANACFMLERNTEAIRNYRKALEFDEHSAIIYRNIGIALARTGELEESIRFLESYTDIATEDIPIRMILAAVYHKSDEIRQAIAIYEKILRENPEDRDALLAISDSYLKLGSPDSALIGYQRIIKSNPADKDAQLRIDSLCGTAPV